MPKAAGAIALITFTLFLSGCNSYSYKPVATSSPSQKVRLVTITDSDGAFVGERHEIYDVQTNSWFEAEEKDDGNWSLSRAGLRAKTAAQSSSESSGGGSC